MKWFVLFLCLLLSGASAEKRTSCQKQELYALAWTIHVPDERHKAMMRWLNENKCSSDEYTAIWNSLSELAGSSDSALLRSKVIQGYEKAIKEEASGK
jgi:hypothetical protein